MTSHIISVDRFLVRAALKPITVKKGDTLMEIFADANEKLDKAEERLNKAIRVTREKPPERKLIIDILD